MADAKINIPVDLILSNLTKGTKETQERSQKAADVLLGSLDTEIATTPYDVVYQEDRIKLKHYHPVTDIKIKTPLLLVYALINRDTMLDLQPGRSTVRNLLEAGVDLYMIDWGYPTRKDKYLTIDDHVNGYMGDSIDFILKKHNLKKINLMGICMGGTFSVIYTAQHPEKVKNLVTTVTPTNFDTDQGLLHIWMKGMDADKMVDAFGNMPGDILNFGFQTMNPARLMLDKYVNFFENIDNKSFVENFVRMEKWIFDSPDVPGETFRQFIKDCYHDNLLIQSKMEVGGQRVNLKKITSPILNFYGLYDNLVPPAACELLTSKVGSKDVEDICLETGHIGIYVSSKMQKQFTPKIVKWLSERDKNKTGPRVGKKVLKVKPDSKKADTLKPKSKKQNSVKSKKQA